MDSLQQDLEKLSISGNKPFISQPSFWDTEGGGDNPASGAPLLDRNNGFLEAKEDSNKDILQRAKRWIEFCGADKVTALPKVAALKGAGTSESIIWRDAERTFKSPSFRQQMITTLEKVADGDYHQGMGYLCGFLLLLLGPDDVAKVLHRVGTDAKYTPGYWKGQPEAFVRDAMVYMRLVEEKLPDVAAHLNKAGLVPEAYAQKWFVGLCVHAMPFTSLIEVFENFLQHGHIYLFKLSLAIVTALAPAILETKAAEVNKLFELLRLDKKVFPDATSTIFDEVLASAKSMELDTAHVEELRRSEMQKLQAKLEQVRAREQALKDEDGDDEIVFSDEDDDEEDEAERLARLAGQ